MLQLLTQASAHRPPLVPQHEAVSSVFPLFHVHGLGDVRQAVALGHRGQDGDFPPGVARLAHSVNDEHCQRVAALLYLTGRYTAGVTHTSSATFIPVTATWAMKQAERVSSQLLIIINPTFRV